MNFLRKVFGGNDPLHPLRKAVARKSWAEALALGEGISVCILEESGRAELASLLEKAGNELARLNLDEGNACLRVGDTARAGEHFHLAQTHAREEELRQAAEEGLKTAERGGAPTASPHAQASCCTAGCSTPQESAPAEDLDPHLWMELFTASLPQEWAVRYARLQGPFLDGVRLAHQGKGREALDLLEAVPQAERDDLYFLERGALLCRTGEKIRGRRDLEQAVTRNPDNGPAQEALVALEMEEGLNAAAEERLLLLLKRGFAPAFCHGRLAVIRLRAGDRSGALEQGKQSIILGNPDPEVILLTASLLEEEGNLDQAEGLLRRLSGGGCGSGANIALAEFRLRQGRDLDKALEDFKAAARQEPDNPRWTVRIGQIYCRLGWKKEGRFLLVQALANPRLPEELREEANPLLHFPAEKRPTT